MKNILSPLLYIVFLIQSNVQIAQTYLLDIPNSFQQEATWCMIGSLDMLLRHHNMNTDYTDQCKIADFVFTTILAGHGQCCPPGYILESCDYMSSPINKLCRGNAADFGKLFNKHSLTRQSTILSSEITNLISKNIPLIFNHDYYESEFDHAMLIKGILQNQNEKFTYLIVNDPLACKPSLMFYDAFLKSGIYTLDQLIYKDSGTTTINSIPESLHFSKTFSLSSNSLNQLSKQVLSELKKSENESYLNLLNISEFSLHNAYTSFPIPFQVIVDDKLQNCTTQSCTYYHSPADKYFIPVWVGDNIAFSLEIITDSIISKGGKPIYTLSRIGESIYDRQIEKILNTTHQKTAESLFVFLWAPYQLFGIDYKNKDLFLNQSNTEINTLEFYNKDSLNKLINY